MHTPLARPPFFSIPKRRRSLALLFLLGFLGLGVVTHAATYYVATSNGNDANTSAQAQNINTPWKTIQKAASTLVAGDTCLIRAGTYRETATMANSGTATSPIIFQAYSGEIVTIDGSDPITGWTPAGSYIWNVSMTGSLGDGNQIFINGAMQPEARWPNAGPTFPWQNSSLAHPSPYSALGDWSYADTAGYTGSSAGWFTDAQLPARAANWSGATVNIMSGSGWAMHSVTVSSYDPATMKITTNDANGPTGPYAFIAGNEYYVTGSKWEMDSVGEWFYDTTASTLSIYTTDPTGPTGVTAKKRYYGFNLSGRTNLRLNNLHFFACTILTDASTANITYDGLVMKYLGHSQKAGASVFGLSLHDGDVLRNSELAWDSRGLVRILGSDVRIINNYLHDSGYVPGWDGNIGGSAGVAGARNLISHNTLQHSGRAAMGFPGQAAIVEYNDMSDGMKLSTDGAIFYANAVAGNAVVRYNLLHDSPGPVGHTGSPVQGFYIDNENTEWVVHHNVIWNVPGYAMQINCRQNFDQVFNNTCWNATAGALLSSFPMNEQSGTHIFNNLFNAPLTGTTWGLSDVRYNLYTDPLFVSPSTGDFRLQSGSPAIDAGTPVPGVTDGYSGAAPDLGALESGGTDWRPSVGYHTTPPSPDPVYAAPAMTFANQVKDGSLESSSLTPNWVTTGAVTRVYGDAFASVQLRSAFRSLQFGVGTSEIYQTVTGLLPNRRYKVYGAVRRTDSSSTVKLGVRNYGFSALETTASVVNRATALAPGEHINADPTWWTMYNKSFVTGATSTSADIYLNVVIPAGGTPVFADDFCLELFKDPAADPVFAMPAFQLPLNESSGTTAFDATTHARNGTVSGGATWSSGHNGNALNFDGSNDYVTVPGAFPAASLGSFTVSTWVKFNDLGTATHYSTLMSNNNGTWAVKGWQVKVTKVSPATSFDVKFYMWDSNLLQAQTQSVGALAPGQWGHVAFVIDRIKGTITGYLNGVPTTTATIPSSFTNVDTANGTRVGDSLFNGQLDDVRADDSALASAPIAALASADLSAKLTLQLDETAGASAAWDASGNGNNGTLVNMDIAHAWDNGALTFDGSDDYVTTPTSIPSTLYESFTVSTWVKFDGSVTNPNYPTLVRNSSSEWGAKGWIVKVARTGTATDFTVLFTMWDSNLLQVPQAILGTITPGQWVHLACVVTRDPGTGAGTIKGYLNGVLTSTQTIPTGFTGVDTGLGTRVGAPAFKGQLDDVRTFSRALSWDEVLNLAKPQDGPPY